MGWRSIKLFYHKVKSLKCLTANFSTSFNLTYIGSPPPTSKPLKPLVIWTPLNGDTPQYVYSNQTKFDWSKIFALFCISAQGGVSSFRGVYMKNDFGGLLVTVGDVTYVPHQNWWSDTLKISTMISEYMSLI